MWVVLVRHFTTTSWRRRHRRRCRTVMRHSFCVLKIPMWQGPRKVRRRARYALRENGLGNYSVGLPVLRGRRSQKFIFWIITYTQVCRPLLLLLSSVMSGDGVDMFSMYPVLKICFTITKIMIFVCSWEPFADCFNNNY